MPYAGLAQVDSLGRLEDGEKRHKTVKCYAYGFKSITELRALVEG